MKALKVAQATIGDLTSRLEMTTKALEEAQSHPNDLALKATIEKLKTENQQSSQASAQVQATVQSTIASNAPLVEKAQAATEATGGWGVVFGSDVSLRGAQDELNRAAKAGIKSGSIYLRNGFYASIAVVDNRATAQDYLTITRTYR